MAQFPSTTVADGIWTLKKVRRAILGDNWPALPTLESDEFFANTVLLLNADNASNGGQNNTFLDSSSNAHTITRNGNVTQGSFSPFSVDEGKWGVLFNLADRELSVANDTSLNLAGTAFTIECWTYLTGDYSDYNHIVSKRQSGGSTSSYQFRIEITTGVLSFWNGTLYTSTGVVPQNEWAHCALTHDGTTMKMFLNGTEVFSQNVTITEQNYPVFIGGSNGYSTGNFSGYLSNVRIVKGTQVYASAFTPPTTPLTDVSGTSLLTCQSNRFVDNSSNAHSITVGGAPKVVPFSPFPQTTVYDASTNGGSGYFEDGDTDVLSIPDSTDFDIYDGDYTVTAWIYPTSFNTFNYFLSKGHSSTREWAFTVTSSNIRAYWSTDGAGSGDQFVTASTTNNLNEWMHLAFVKSGSTITIYKNGVSIGSGSFTSIYSGSDPLYISRFMDFTGIAHSHDGYISNLRIVKGTAIAPSGIPTAPVTDVTNTSLLTNFTNASIKDATGKNVLETVGNAQVDTTTVKYGTGAMEFDGSATSAINATSPVLASGTGDMTMEFWLYPTSLPSFQGVVDTWMEQTSGTGFYVWLSGASFDLVKDSSTYYYNSSSTDITANQWQHVAITRASNTVRVFVDGTQLYSVTITDDWTSEQIEIGNIQRTYANSFNGYIDDFRYTVGIARYTANFTPPEKELPVIGA